MSEVIRTETNKNVEQIKILAFIEIQHIVQKVANDGRDTLNSYELDCLNNYVKILNITEDMNGGQLKVY